MGFEQGERNLLDGGTCEAKTLKPLIGEASCLLSCLPSLKIRAAQVLDLRATFWILKISEERKVRV